MERAEEWARAKGATSIELNVYAFNEIAQRFYRELGYEILSHRMTKAL
jgi:ribosomal protein S18 acetylase RimI-like enzyme